MEKYLRVGVITSPHGVRGEVKVYPTTDDVMRFKKLDKVILDLGRGETRELKIRQVKFFKNMVILKFDGVDTMNEVEGWRKKDLPPRSWCPRHERGGRLASEGSSYYKRSGDPAGGG